MRRQYLLAIGLAVTMAMTLSVPALAGGKGGGGHVPKSKPQESVSSKYGKVQQTYTSQKTTSKRRATENGRKIVRPHDFHINF